MEEIYVLEYVFDHETTLHHKPVHFHINSKEKFNSLQELATRTEFLRAYHGMKLKDLHITECRKYTAADIFARVVLA